MTFSQFLQIIRARWLIALITLIVVASAVIGVSLILPKRYTATASIIIDFKPDPISIAFGGTGVVPSFLATQIDIINSDRVARRVVRTLKLAESAETRQRWMESTEGQGDIESWLIDSLQRSLDVRPSRESNVITVSFSGANAKFAEILANAFVQAYIDTSLDLRVDPARQYASFFDLRSKKLREELELAQNRLSAFQRANGIVGADERIDVETARLGELSAQLVLLQGLSAESSSRQAQARTAGDQLQDVLNNPLIASLKGEVSRHEARLQELSPRLGEKHPQITELKALIAELKLKVDAETRKVTASTVVSNSINRGREAEVRGSLEAQRNKVLRLKELRDEMMVLQRDVENAQRAYDGVLQRLNQTSLESQTTQTNVSFLTPASEPSRPSSPRVVLNGVLSIFFGILLGIAFSLLAELRNRRIRSEMDVIGELQLPVLGTMLKPASRRTLRKNATPLMMRKLIGQLPAPQPK